MSGSGRAYFAPNDLREALRRSESGQSGLNVYGYRRTDGTAFRIVDYKNHRGLHYGKVLVTGKWMVIADWEAR